VHNAGAHLVDYVEGWGPLWAWSTFGFEDMNGTLMDFCHGTGNVCRQVQKCHSYLIQLNNGQYVPYKYNLNFKSHLASKSNGQLMLHACLY